jgi:hypothetical protein
MAGHGNTLAVPWLPLALPPALPLLPWLPLATCRWRDPKSQPNSFSHIVYDHCQKLNRGTAVNFMATSKTDLVASTSVIHV